MKNGRNPLVATYEIKRPRGDCYVVLTHMNASGEKKPLIIYTNGTRVEGHWYLSKTEMFTYVPLVFLNFDFEHGKTDPTLTDQLRGVYQLEFAHGTKIFFFATFSQDYLGERARKILAKSSTRFEIGSAESGDFQLCLNAGIALGDPCPVEAEESFVEVSCHHRNGLEIRFPNASLARRNVTLACLMKTRNLQVRLPEECTRFIFEFPSYFKRKRC